LTITLLSRVTAVDHYYLPPSVHPSIKNFIAHATNLIKAETHLAEDICEMVFFITPVRPRRSILFSPRGKPRRNHIHDAMVWQLSEARLKAQEEVADLLGDPGNVVMDYLYAPSWNNFDTPFKK